MGGKKEIIRKKSKLKKGVYIDDNLTKEERGIQIKLRERAREERAKGISAKVGYKKVKIGNKWNI